MTWHPFHILSRCWLYEKKCYFGKVRILQSNEMFTTFPIIVVIIMFRQTTEESEIWWTQNKPGWADRIEEKMVMKTERWDVVISNCCLKLSPPDMLSSSSFFHRIGAQSSLPRTQDKTKIVVCCALMRSFNPLLAISLKTWRPIKGRFPPSCFKFKLYRISSHVYFGSCLKLTIRPKLLLEGAQKREGDHLTRRKF